MADTRFEVEDLDGALAGVRSVQPIGELPAAGGQTRPVPLVVGVEGSHPCGFHGERQALPFGGGEALAGDAHLGHGAVLVAVAVGGRRRGVLADAHEADLIHGAVGVDHAVEHGVACVAEAVVVGVLLAGVGVLGAVVFIVGDPVAIVVGLLLGVVEVGAAVADITQSVAVAVELVGVGVLGAVVEVVQITVTIVVRRRRQRALMVITAHLALGAVGIAEAETFDGLAQGFDAFLTEEAVLIHHANRRCLAVRIGQVDESISVLVEAVLAAVRRPFGFELSDLSIELGVITLGADPREFLRSTYAAADDVVARQADRNAGVEVPVHAVVEVEGHDVATFEAETARLLGDRVAGGLTFLIEDTAHLLVGVAIAVVIEAVLNLDPRGRGLTIAGHTTVAIADEFTSCLAEPDAGNTQVSEAEAFIGALIAVVVQAVTALIDGLTGGDVADETVTGGVAVQQALVEALPHSDEAGHALLVEVLVDALVEVVVLVVADLGRGVLASELGATDLPFGAQRPLVDDLVQIVVDAIAPFGRDHLTPVDAHADHAHGAQVHRMLVGLTVAVIVHAVALLRRPVVAITAIGVAVTDQVRLRIRDRRPQGLGVVLAARGHEEQNGEREPSDVPIHRHSPCVKGSFVNPFFPITRY